MQPRMDTEPLLMRRPFDLQEAVVLLDVYLSMVKKGIPMTRAAETASLRLRSMAERNGYAVSDSYRSSQGLSNRLRSIAGLYENNSSKSVPGTVVFAEAVFIYKNDRERYEAILRTENAEIQQANSTAKDRALSHKRNSAADSTGDNGVAVGKVEEYLRSAALHGASVKELIEIVQPGVSINSINTVLNQNMNVICMPGNRYVHADSFVDMDEAEEALGQILKTHFAQFGGYSNNQLLFGAAAQELSMFLNDNDCGNINAVYAVARFLFEKKAAAGKPYKFSAPHIFETEPDYPMTRKGLMIRLARSGSGILYAADARDYLQKIKLNCGSIGQLLRIGSSNAFLVYDSDKYLLSDTIGIDDDWCRRIHDRLDDLFRQADVAYVIPRDISAAWLETLPTLPHGLGWTRLLLQEILDKYPAVGFKSVSPDLNQTHDTLAAAFVPADSPLQSFPDVVTLFMEERHELPARMTGADLRLELRNAGMLENNEMIYALPKALNDYRFAWSDNNKTVYVLGNK